MGCRGLGDGSCDGIKWEQKKSAKIKKAGKNVDMDVGVPAVDNDVDWDDPIAEVNQFIENEKVVTVASQLSKHIMGSCVMREFP